jgi:hypothetical protein
MRLHDQSKNMKNPRKQIKKKHETTSQAEQEKHEALLGKSDKVCWDSSHELSHGGLEYSINMTPYSNTSLCR